MSTWGWVVCAAALSLIGYETVRGWQTGRINYRALDGDREKSPVIYWFLMTLNAVLITGITLAILGIYGEPF